MIGEKVQEIVGKITGTRVLAGDGGGVKVETSFQGAGKLVGVDTIELGTYKSTMTPSGHLHGDGHGTSMSPTGDMASWKGSEVGKPTGKGMGASYRYAVYFQTTSPKWSRLNGVVVVGEWEIDENGNTKGQGWEWK